MSGKILQVDILGYTKGVNDSEVSKLIEKGGRTAYQSQDKITEDSAERFVRALRKSGHESVIEHSWFTFHLCLKGLRYDTVAHLLLANSLLTVTFREKEGTVLVSGNARMWRDFFRSDYWNVAGDNELRHILIKVLAEKYPVLFEDLDFDKDIVLPSWLIYSPHLDYTLREMKKHWWAMVRFHGGTRAFTHQFVRHRYKVGITQESQRYCDEKGFFGRGYFSVPLSVKEAAAFSTKDGIFLEDWYLEKLETLDGWYRELQDYLRQARDKGMTQGKVNEDARYLLPNAVCSEVVLSAPLEEWRWVFKMRTAPDAQWEIRMGMLKLLKQFQNIFPGVFDDFQIDEAKRRATVSVPSIGY